MSNQMPETNIPEQKRLTDLAIGEIQKGTPAALKDFKTMTSGGEDAIAVAAKAEKLMGAEGAALAAKAYLDRENKGSGGSVGALEKEKVIDTPEFTQSELRLMGLRWKIIAGKKISESAVEELGGQAQVDLIKQGWERRQGGVVEENDPETNMREWSALGGTKGVRELKKLWDFNESLKELGRDYGKTSTAISREERILHKYLRLGKLTKREKEVLGGEDRMRLIKEGWDRRNGGERSEADPQKNMEEWGALGGVEGIRLLKVMEAHNISHDDLRILRGVRTKNGAKNEMKVELGGEGAIQVEPEAVGVANGLEIYPKVVDDNVIPGEDPVIVEAFGNAENVPGEQPEVIVSGEEESAGVDDEVMRENERAEKAMKEYYNLTILRDSQGLNDDEKKQIGDLRQYLEYHYGDGFEQEFENWAEKNYPSDKTSEKDVEEAKPEAAVGEVIDVELPVEEVVAGGNEEIPADGSEVVIDAKFKDTEPQEPENNNENGKARPEKEEKKPGLFARLEAFGKRVVDGLENLGAGVRKGYEGVKARFERRAEISRTMASVNADHAREQAEKKVGETVERVRLIPHYQRLREELIKEFGGDGYTSWYEVTYKEIDENGLETVRIEFEKDLKSAAEAARERRKAAEALKMNQEPVAA